jgi:hypothetical protein
MKKENIQQLKIPQHAKQRSRSAVGLIYGVIVILLAVATWFAWPRNSDNQRIVGNSDGNERITGSAESLKHFSNSCFKTKSESNSD